MGYNCSEAEGGFSRLLSLWFGYPSLFSTNCFKMKKFILKPTLKCCDLNFLSELTFTVTSHLRSDPESMLSHLIWT